MGDECGRGVKILNRKLIDMGFSFLSLESKKDTSCFVLTSMCPDGEKK